MNTSFINSIRVKLSLSDRVTQCDGCSQTELEILQQSQQVACLPENYQALMLLMGKRGIGCLFGGLANYEACLGFKERFIGERQLARIGYPDDLFVFYQDSQGTGYFFFRTQDCLTDPPIYMYMGHDCYYRYADSFSELVLDYFADDFNTFPGPVHERRMAALETEYIYNSANDSLQSRVSPYTQPLKMEQILEVIQTRWGDLAEGCTQQEIDQIRVSQAVACLPETYRMLMAEIGKFGLFYILISSAEYPQVLKLKAMFLAEDIGLYPNDLFVLSYLHESRHVDRYYVFRTKDCLDDPRVYEIIIVKREDSPKTTIYQCGKTLSEFILHKMDVNTERRRNRTEEQKKHSFYYDPQQDIFLEV